MGASTSVDGGVAILKVGLDVLTFGISEGVDDVSDGRGDLEMVEAGCGCDDGLDVVLGESGLGGGGVEVADEEGAAAVLGGQHYVATRVFFFAREIIKHNNYMHSAPQQILLTRTAQFSRS